MPAWLTLILMMLGVAGAGVLIVITLIARDILRPPRVTDARAIIYLHRLSPGDLGLRFEDCSFDVRDTASASRRLLRLAAWWIPSPRRSGSCAILLHGHGDAKVGAIAWAPLLHHLNINVLAMDSRAHGESGGSHATAGFFERDDLSQVIDQLRASHPGESERLILFGLDSGGTTAAATAVMRDDVAAVIIDSPIVDRHRVLATHARRVGLPAGAMLSAALRWAAISSGADFAAVSLRQSLPRLRCPLLVIVGEQDEMLSEEDIGFLADQAPPGKSPRRMVVIPQAQHLMALQIDPGGYTTAVSSFLVGATPG